MNPNSAATPQGNLPLDGKRIVITRARSKAASLARAIEDLGGNIFEFATIEIQPAADLGPLDEAIKNLAVYDWLMFTSVNGAEIFFERFSRLQGARHWPADLQFAAIGPETAKRLESAGVKNCLIPKTYQAEGILEMLQPSAMRGKRVLIPRAAGAREVLPETLRRWGAQADVIESYRTILPKTQASELKEKLWRREIDMVTFTSSSTVSNFSRLFDDQPLAGILGETPIACIGPIAENTVAELGGIAAVSAREFTIRGLVRAIAEYFQGNVPSL
jgi:uroporphyrinogen III methyltransferase/synthase